LSQERNPALCVALVIMLIFCAESGVAQVFDLTPVEEPAIISDQVSDTNKVKILRMPNGTLIAVYGQGQTVGQLVYDLKARATRDPWDLVLQYSTDEGETWSAPVNFDNTAAQSSGLGIIEETGAPPLFPGGELYLTEQITSGHRSVKQDVPVPQQPGFGVIWQEDPLGLQLGNAEGPGTGASGANSTGGTDVWYMHLDTNNNSTPDFIANDWSEPVRLTGNTTNTRDLQGPLRTSHGPGLYEDGKAAAARPQLRLIGRRAVFAWEEKKATTGIDEGKYIRYHTIPEFTDTSALPINGCIISRPIENGRRVRILTQPLSAGSTGIVFIYKQGDFTQGGPSDIMLRRAVGGYEPNDVVPAIDTELTGIFGERCRAHVNNQDDDLVGDDELMDDPLNDIRFGTLHLSALNFSGSAAYLDQPGTAPDVESGLNPFENALAHRGQLRGDTLVVGFSHVPDQARFDFLDDAIPYNFYMRSSQDGGDSWGPSVNVSNLTPESGLSAREPRIVGTPGNGPGCADPQNPTDPTDCRNNDIMYFGFGTQTNVTNLELPEDVDIFMGATQDGGQTFSGIQAITAGDALFGIADDDADLETQLKLRPDGLQAFVVWTSTPETTDDVAFRELELDPDLIFRDGFEAP